MNNPFIIAEIGINHNGDVEIAKKLISMAKNTDCDAVKFQKRNPELCVPKAQRQIMRETPWGIIPYQEYRYRIELGAKDYREIDRYCKEIGIEWFASAWDLDSLRFLEPFQTKYNKVGSALLTNIPLVKRIACEGKHTFISTGMSTMEQIDEAVSIFENLRCPFTLMHCISTYPCHDEECNLRMIETLQMTYDRHRMFRGVGYSGHEVGVLPSVLAVTMGAIAIERHITLDRALMWGGDQGASMEKRGLELLVRDCRSVASILGDGIKRVSQGELELAKKLRFCE